MIAGAAVGVDGCRGGWVVVAIGTAGERAMWVAARFSAVVDAAPRRAMIDMPIGLPDSGYRACDLAARSLLGAARSRVFLGARRPLLAFTDYDAANGWAKRDGNGLSRQTWNILPKIAEIDAAMSPARQARLLEAHPELVFQRFNAGRALAPKKSPAGARQRRHILAAMGFDRLDDWIAGLRGGGAGADDLFDACVLALAAREPAGPIACAPERDRRGLRMEIWR